MCSMSKAQQKGSQSKPRERRTFAADFKQEAVRLLYERRAAGVSVNQIARDLDVRPESLRQWAHQLRDRSGGVLLSDGVETPAQELRRLRREIAVLRQEREFAKKVAVYFAKESR